jgi:hypothetical protein
MPCIIKCKNNGENLSSKLLCNERERGKGREALTQKDRQKYLTLQSAEFSNQNFIYYFIKEIKNAIVLCEHPDVIF